MNRDSRTPEQNGPDERPIVLIGDTGQGGTYVLRMRVHRRLRMPFGRFRGGKIITVEPGDHSYVGSALSESGATSLGRRLVRHATRTGCRRPHRIRRLMLKEFARIGLGRGDLRLRGEKKYKWNVDHLLDRRCVDLVGVLAIRSPVRLEAQLEKLLQQDPATVEFERGLGANDIPGNTHLLRVDAGDEWWDDLPARLQALLPAGDDQVATVPLSCRR